VGEGGGRRRRRRRLENAPLELEGADEPLDPDEEEGPERELLYEEEDFRAWLDDLRAIPPPEPLVTD
jgi:DNA-directed RNA polymerase specialized sigma24 family protein